MSPNLIDDLLARPTLATVADLTALLLLTAYHLYLWRVYRLAPERTYRGCSNRLRHAWVEGIRAGTKDILAVQTLRNWVMSATMFASTSIVIGLGILKVAFDGLSLDTITHALSIAPTMPALVPFKLLLVAAIFFGSFMHFALALRYYNHTGFMINLPANHFKSGEVDLIADTLNKAGGHYNRGTRGYLLALPFLLWLIGPDWFLGSVIVVLVMYWRFDYHNRGDDDGSTPVAPSRRRRAGRR